MLPWSVMPMAGWPSAAARAITSSTRAAPSSMENSVWRCRCANDEAISHLPARTATYPQAPVPNLWTDNTCVVRPHATALSQAGPARPPVLPGPQGQGWATGTCPAWAFPRFRPSRAGRWAGRGGGPLPSGRAGPSAGRTRWPGSRGTALPASPLAAPGPPAARPGTCRRSPGGGHGWPRPGVPGGPRRAAGGSSTRSASPWPAARPSRHRRCRQPPRKAGDGGLLPAPRSGGAPGPGALCLSACWSRTHLGAPGRPSAPGGVPRSGRRQGPGLPGPPVAGHDHEAHFGAHGDVARPVGYLGAMERVQPAVVGPHLAEPGASVEALDLSPLVLHGEPPALFCSGHDLADRQLDYVRGPRVFELGYQLVDRLFGHHRLHRVAATPEQLRDGRAA